MTQALKTMLMSRFVSQEMGMMLTDPKQNDLIVLADLMQSGKVKPVIDRTYTLEQLPDAVRYVEEGHARGKVVITWNGNNGSKISTSLTPSDHIVLLSEGFAHSHSGPRYLLLHWG